MSRIFLTPPWVQATLVVSVFVALLLLMQEFGWWQTLIYLILSVWLGVAFAFNIRIGLSARTAVFVRGGRGDVTTTRSKNDIAAMAALKTDPFLAPFSRPLLIPVRSALLTVIFFSGIGWGWICILLGLAQVLMKKLVQRVALVEFTAGQVRRDRNASAIVTHLLSGKPPTTPYYLYLRPFAITGTLHAEDPSTVDKALRGGHPTEEYSGEGKRVGLQWPVVNADVSMGEAWSASELNPEWEAIFEKGFRRLGSLVALGRPGESVGAGRILTKEHEWQEILIRLSHQTSGFLVVPSSNPGTLWEIKWLRDTLAFRNCYFFFPGWQSRRSDRTAWQALRKQLWPILRLPALMEMPGMFALDTDGYPHVAFVSGTAVLSGGTDARMFVTSSGIECAVQTLAPIATRSGEPETRHWIEMADRLMGALAHGREELLELRDLADDFQRLVRDAQDSDISGLWRLAAFLRTAGSEEVYHHSHVGHDAVTLRQEGTLGDTAGSVYVQIAIGDERSRILGLSFVPEDGLEQRMHCDRSGT